mgnify:CR=1 FL=1
MTIYQTSGNPYGHIIMRGGKKPNYHADDIAAACDTLHEFDLPEHLVVDFSHGNCQKQHRRQLEVCEDICQQIRNGSTAIAGIMAESFPARRNAKNRRSQPLTYGQSITDRVWLGRYRTPGRKTRLCGRYPLLNACPFLMGWAFLRNLLSSQHITACSG